MKYKKTHEGIMRVLKKFHEHKLNYLLFKCEHIFEGENKNLDILFETDEEYLKAAKLLEELNFVQRFSEKFEKYKMMYCGFYQNKIYSIHLHREIAWHGIKALDKGLVFQRKRAINPLIIVPSLEDSILIHAAHVLFENFKVTEKEKKFLDRIDEPATDKSYIKKQLEKNRWKKGFNKVIACKNKSERNGMKNKLNKKRIFLSLFSKLIKEPSTLFYVSKKILKIPLRKLIFKRRGCLISLIGVNGVGKSTLTRELLKSYQDTTKHLGIKQHYYYFGWKPTFFLTKIISKKFKKSRKQIFKETALSQKIKKFSLKQELNFIYQYWEFYYRYLAEIRSKLRKNNLVVTDRYFYDLYGQYPYSRNSVVLPLLLQMFPKPDFTYLLDAPVEELQKRKKVNKEKVNKMELIERKVLPFDYLQQQRENYLALKEKLGDITVINTEEPKQRNVSTIIGDTWRKLL